MKYTCFEEKNGLKSAGVLCEPGLVACVRMGYRDKIMKVWTCLELCMCMCCKCVYFKPRRSINFLLINVQKKFNGLVVFLDLVEIHNDDDVFV